MITKGSTEEEEERKGRKDGTFIGSGSVAFLSHPRFMCKIIMVEGREDMNYP